MDLTNKSVDELRSIAHEVGAEVHHRAGKDLLMNAIVTKLMEKVERNPVEEKTVVKEESTVLKPDEVRAALKHLTDKHESLELSFLKDGTWLLQLGKFAESGNMQMPLSVLVRKAEQFCRPRVVRALGRDGNDSSYTGTVLSA